MLRAIGQPASASATAADPYTSSAAVDFREGDKVEGNFRGRGRWYPGKVGRVRLNGTFDIDYDDGEKEAGVEKSMLRAIGQPARSTSAPADFREGDKVEGNYRGRGRWYPGKIGRVRLNGTFDVY